MLLDVINRLTAGQILIIRFGLLLVSPVIPPPEDDQPKERGMAPKGDFIPSIRAILAIYRIFGMYRAKNQPIQYRIYRWLLNIPFLFVYLLVMLYSALQEKNSENLWRNTFFIMLTEMAMFVKTATVYCRFREIMHLLELSISEDFSPKGPCEQQRYQRVTRHLNTVLLSYLIVCIVTASSTAIHIFDGHYQLPIHSWFFGVPYGPDHEINYLLISIYQVLGMLMHCALNVAGDIQIPFLLAIAGIQLDFLETRFVDLKKEYLVQPRRQLFIRHAQHFRLVGQFVRDIERVYSPAAFCQFCASVITICATAFRIFYVRMKSKTCTTYNMH